MQLVSEFKDLDNIKLIRLHVNTCLYEIFNVEIKKLNKNFKKFKDSDKIFIYAIFFLGDSNHFTPEKILFQNYFVIFYSGKLKSSNTKKVFKE